VVTWSHQAKVDLHHIFEFIADDSKHYARKVTQDIAEKTNILNELPRIGKIVPEVGDDKVRELPLYSYRILYEIMNQNIVILALVHKRRNFKVKEIGK